MDGKLFQGVQVLGKSGLCDGQLADNCSKAVPHSTGPTMWSHENGLIIGILREKHQLRLRSKNLASLVVPEVGKSSDLAKSDKQVISSSATCKKSAIAVLL